jgi:uncharacterized protein YneF (UPF0154 family)
MVTLDVWLLCTIALLCLLCGLIMGVWLARPSLSYRKP